MKGMEISILEPQMLGQQWLAEGIQPISKFRFKEKNISL